MRKVLLPTCDPGVSIRQHPDFNAEVLGKLSLAANRVKFRYFYPNSTESCTLRQYQVDCTEAALLRNCMISLPTGLGKTFIAAVIMYRVL